MGRMSLFLKTRNRRVPERFYMQKISSGILEKVKDFTENLELPESEHRIYIELASQVRGIGRGQLPYCLFILADQEDISSLNAGYIAGQAAVYLKFLGFRACILRELPAYTGQKYAGKICIGAVTFGKDEEAENPKSRDMVQKEDICICRNLQEHWAEDVLALAKKRFHISGSNVQIIRGDNCVYFTPKFRTGKKKSTSEFETGTAIAYALAAAEELWVDLVLIKSEDSGHGICLMNA